MSVHVTTQLKTRAEQTDCWEAPWLLELGRILERRTGVSEAAVSAAHRAVARDDRAQRLVRVDPCDPGRGC